jgi:hypothetical protein
MSLRHQSSISFSEPTSPAIGLKALQATPGWSSAIDSLRRAWETGGEHARVRAQEIRSNFRGQRGLMVLDVVLSRQRRYDSRVAPMLARWTAKVTGLGAQPTLAFVAEHPDSYVEFAARTGEADTTAAVARSLLRYGSDHGLTEDNAICEAWASSTVGLEVAPRLDPYVGSIRGIGPALFAYARLLCGADTIKPDVRVLRQLRAHGIEVEAKDAVAAFLAAQAVAHELGIDVVELDQLLWYAEP